MSSIKHYKSESYKVGGGKMSIREFYYEYRSELVFGFLLTALVVASYMLSPLIPLEVYRKIISPTLNCAILLCCAMSAWALFRHHQGIRVRKMSGYVMTAWVVALSIGMWMKLSRHNSLTAADGMLSMDGWEFVLGSILGWLLLVYPTELLRPGWLNFKRAMIDLLPVVLIGVLDALLDTDMRWLLAAYPFVLLAFIVVNIRAYRAYCENYYSSMEDIDVQWVVRYIIMLVILGASYCFLSFARFPTRLFTQQWLLFFFLFYSNEQILFRPDPWVGRVREREEDELAGDDNGSSLIGNETHYRAALEQWMVTGKPYLNKDFRLTDLRQVLPLNRTYLSQFINTEYGCSFYQYVTKYRIEEAKRLMRENPQMKVQEISDRCGFSSSTVFGRVFARETGRTPKEWIAQNNNT